MLHAPDADAGSVVGLFGVASLFGFIRVSEVMRAIERDVRGRIVVFFPGEYVDSNYRLLDARDGWNYLAVPITLQGDPGGIRRMKNRDVYQKDPDQITLLNNGVAAMTDALDPNERSTLRFELEHFVCEGQYRSGLVRILESWVSHQGQPEQPAAWISGFFGSGKSHLAKVLRFLWTDYTVPGGRCNRSRTRAVCPTMCGNC